MHSASIVDGRSRFSCRHARGSQGDRRTAGIVKRSAAMSNGVRLEPWMPRTLRAKPLHSTMVATIAGSADSDRGTEVRRQ
jgi:hypothetical protein